MAVVVSEWSAGFDGEITTRNTRQQNNETW